MSNNEQAVIFTGKVSDGYGVALWQADGTGPEPAAVGHTFITPIEPITAHYYVASRDYVDVAKRGGMHATELTGAWPRFTKALQEAKRRLPDLVMRLPLTTAGADREGEDWFYSDGVETRYLRPQAPLPLSLNSHALLAFASPRLTLVEDYRNARHFGEVRLSITSERTTVQVAAGASAGPFAPIAEAFLADLAGRSVRLVVDTIQLTDVTFDGNGRTSGRFAEIPHARLEVL